MDWRDELKQLVHLCSKRTNQTKPRQFPKEENGLLAVQVRCWMEAHQSDLNTASDQTEISKLRQELRNFLIIHKAATQGPLPAPAATEICCYVVIDTNIFFHCEYILDRFDESCIIVLPTIVLDELRNRLRFNDAKSRQSQRILTRIRHFPAKRLQRIKVSEMESRRFRTEFPAQSQNDRCDDHILAAAKLLQKEKKPTQLLSDDVALRERAAASGIPACSLREFFGD